MGDLMKANIPREHELAIYDYIYLNLIVEILEGKAAKGMDLDEQIKKVLGELRLVKDYLRKNQIKVDTAKVDPDNLFVQYDFHCKVEDGYREGFTRYWRSALAMTLNNKMKLLQKGESLIESDLR